MTPPPPKRMRLSVQQKLDSYDEMINGTSYEALSTNYGFAIRTLNRIRRAAPEIREKGTSTALSLQHKSLRKIQFPDVDQNVLKFITFCRTAQKPVTLNVIQQGALCLLYTSPSPRDQRGSRMPSSA